LGADASVEETRPVDLHWAVLRFALLLGSCAPAPADSTEAPAEDTAVAIPELEPVALLTRVSLDLRGVRPSLEEIAAVGDDPSVLDAWVADWVRAPAFAERVAWWWDDALHTAVWADDYQRFGTLEFATWRAIGQEPLRVVRGVVEEDRPFSDIVTTPETMADPTLAALYGLPYTGADGGWGWTTYPDGRPMAGVLSSTSLWLRHTGDVTNFNRRRANLVASALLCADFLGRDGQFTFAIDPDTLTNIEEAVRTDPACLSCHAALDPLAALFGGFAERSLQEPEEQYVRYSFQNEAWYMAWTAPGYFGRPVAGLAELGELVAADPRFDRCAVRRSYEALVSDASFDDEPAGDALAAAFRDEDGERISALVARIVATPRYRSATLRTLTPEQLQTALVDLLGWGDGAGDGVDADDLDDGLVGLAWRDELRVLAGGTDDETILRRNGAPGAALQVVLDWAARQAVPAALAADRARPAADRRLLTAEDDPPTQLAAWYTRFLGVPVEPDGPEVTRLLALWEGAGGGDAGWEIVLEALVRHPRMVLE
jgi:hypothetical protein